MPSIQEKFTQLFGHAPSLMVQSPGRINLIGEHTDYNHGFVLPAAIDKYVQIAFEHRTDGMIHMHAIDLHETVTVPAHPLQPHTITWVNYIIGVVAQVQDYLTYAVHNKETLYKLNEGFDICIQGDIPIGAGLSSSAAVESAVIFALNEWYALGLSKMQMALMAQKAEHEFAGVKCGIMDMFASIHGEANQVMLLDCQDLSFKYYSLPLKDYCIVLFDTSIKHALASSEYNTRRLECEQGLKILQETYPAIQTFRDVSVRQVEECLSLYKNINPSSVTTNQSLISSKVYQRCKYVVEEIERVQLAVKYLLVGDMKAFGQKMFATHRGLSELYEVSCPELDVLVNAVKDSEYVLGARMMGGGFGGCTINIIKSDQVQNIIAQVTEKYHHATHKKLHTYQVKIEQGTHII
jgi:galactokinase